MEPTTHTALIARWLVGTGLLLIAAGALVWLVGKSGLPLGKLPGDLHVERDGFSLHAPIATSILVSILLSIGLTLALNLFGKHFGGK